MWKSIATTAGLLLLTLTGCGLKGPLTNWLITEGSYRLSATLCSEPEEALGETGALLGLSFEVTQVGNSCESDALHAFVSAGRAAQLKKARRLKIHQSVILTGSFDGAGHRTLMVEKLKIR